MVHKITRRVSRSKIILMRPIVRPVAAIESLESRTLLSSVVVNTVSDAASGSGVVTLSDAVATANSSTTPTTITFDPAVFATAQTITLGGAELELTNTAESTTITGPTVGVTVSGGDVSRVFRIEANVSLGIDRVSVVDGNGGSDTSPTPTTPDGKGGGILVYLGATLNMSNASVDSSFAAYGGGIDSAGTVELTNVTLSDNTALKNGGAVGSGEFTGTYNSSGASLTILDSTLVDNTAIAGGGLASYFGAVIVTNSTITANTVTAGTGTAANGGGGLLLYGGPALIDDTTISGNTSEGNAGGGGVCQVSSGVQMANSIIASNTSTSNGGPDVLGSIASSGYNLIGEADGSSGWIGTDLTGAVASPLNADLGALASNGGTTETMLPEATSPVIGNGSAALIPAGVTTDQRGDPRTINGAVDIGAVEVGGTAVIKGASATTMTASAHTLVVGQSDTFNVAVTPASDNGPIPTGTISVYEDGNLKGTYTLTNGQVSEPITAVNQALNTLYTAIYSGDSNYSVSSAAGVTQVYLPASAATARVTKAVVPAAVIAGQKIMSRVSVVLTNTGASMSGPFSEVLYADAPNTGLDTVPVEIGSLTKRTTLKAGRTLTIPISIKTLPASLPAGTYHMTAEITDPNGEYDLVTTTQTVSVAEPFVSLTPYLSTFKPSIVASNKPASVVVTLTNTGNVAAAGPASLMLNASSDGSTGLSTTLVSLTPRISIRPGKSVRITLRFKATSELSAGAYTPLLSVLFEGVTTTATGFSFEVNG